MSVVGTRTRNRRVLPNRWRMYWKSLCCLKCMFHGPMQKVLSMVCLYWRLKTCNTLFTEKFSREKVLQGQRLLLNFLVNNFCEKKIYISDDFSSFLENKSRNFLCRFKFQDKTNFRKWVNLSVSRKFLLDFTERFHTFLAVW